MKKWLIIIGSIILALIVGISAFFIVKAVRKEDKKGPQYEVLHIEDSYAQGEQIVLRVKMTSDKQLKKMAYTLNNGTEQNFTVETGKTEDAEDMPGNGENYIDTGTELIATDSLAEGWYTLIIYAYDADDTRLVVTKTPILFQVTASTAA